MLSDRLGDRMEDVDEGQGPLTVDGIDGIIALVVHHKCRASKVELYLTFKHNTVKLNHLKLKLFFSGYRLFISPFNC